MSVRIESDIESAYDRISRLLKQYEDRIEEAKDEVRDRALEITKDEAPVLTGKFRESIVADGTADEVTIHSTHPKAKQIIAGTRPSPGLYIKEAKGVGKRLTKRSGRKDIGMHPGTPPHPVFEKAYERILPMVRELLEERLRR